VRPWRCAQPHKGCKVALSPIELGAAVMANPDDVSMGEEQEQVEAETTHAHDDA
jgi:hypothetical protein